MSGPYYQDDAVTLWHGDCLDVMATMPDASVHAVVTDPPYGLEFMGKEWDQFGGRPARFRKPTDADARISGITRGSMPDAYRAGPAFGAWCTQWAAECLRVLKPGGHLLAFGGTRTWHRLAVAIEDAGFEIRDSIAWLYGSGFPKSLDVSKAIDRAAGAAREVVGYDPRSKGIKPGHSNYGGGGAEYTAGHDITAPATPAAQQWAGWGTALKPAFEPIVVARKPLAGTVAQNVLAHGTGALNVDGCRVATSDSLGGGANKGMTSHTRHEGFARPWMDDDDAREAAARRSRENTARAEAAGRWPTNVVLDDTAAAELDRQSGDCPGFASGGTKGAGFRRDYVGGESQETTLPAQTYGDSGGASRFFPTFKYEAKAPTEERPRAGGVAHPTVKPLDLMRWLVRLVTPPGGTVLDPFAGSGTTAEACVIEGFRCITIEREADYLPLILARLTKPIEPVLDLGALG